jgi:N6-L-threonylcarbamoyladenine synthase
VIGTTLDDAAGEAFDKIAKMLGLEYPGGPLVDKIGRKGNPERFKFPKPRVDGFNYSFSGLKTSVLYFLRDEIKKDPDFIEKNLPDICASVQHTIINVLMDTLEKCALAYDIKHIALAGGVSANSALRNAMVDREKILNWKTYIPPMHYCTDNAGMIGITAYYKYLEQSFDSLTAVSSARLPF